MSLPINYGGLPIGLFVQQPIPLDWRYVFDTKTDLNDFLSNSLEYTSFAYDGLYTYVKSTEHYYSITYDTVNEIWIANPIPKIWISDTQPDAGKTEEGDIWVQP